MSTHAARYPSESFSFSYSFSFSGSSSGEGRSQYVGSGSLRNGMRERVGVGERFRSVRRNARAAFTLVELIGVLAIIAIMATLVAPNAIKALDRAAVRAEAENLKTMGEQVKLHLINRGELPAVATWHQQLAAYTDLNQHDVQLNKRRMARVYLIDPDPAKTPAERVIILSSMREGVGFPATLNALTPAQFNAMWNAADDTQVPTLLAWAGWTAELQSDYFVMQRVNVAGLRETASRTFTITLSNASGSDPLAGTGGEGEGGESPLGAPVAFRQVRKDGAVAASGELNPTSSIELNCTVSDEILLFNGSNHAVPPGYTYIVTDSDRSFEFTEGKYWRSR